MKTTILKYVTSILILILVSLLVSTPLYAQTPTITTQPLGQTLCVGNTFTTTVVATNATDFEWYLDGTLIIDGSGGNGSMISGATTATLTISNLCATCNPGDYTVKVISASSIEVLSDPATLTINTPADITTAPLLSYTKCEGEDLVLSVVATGNPAPVYQWQQNGVDLVGETGSSLTLSDMILSDAGTYSVIASNACGSDSYGSIVVSVNPHPVIVTDPISVTKCAGETQTFTVAATNAGSYQWYKDNVALSDGVSGGGSIIAGATSTSLTISNLCATCNPGAYHVEVHGTGACLSDIAVSHSATLTINIPADITTAPLLSYTKCEGEDLVLSVVATGNPAPVYQWQQNGIDLVGETGSSLTLSDMISSDAGTYSVIASNACGSDSYGSIVVSVNPHPVIVTDPISVTKCAGETQTFTVAATNAGSYQWYKDNVALSDGVSGGGSTIAGATSTSLTISNLCATCNPGAYHVEVHGTGACSSEVAVSHSATLTINTPADITTAPLLSYTKCEGEDLVLSVVATGNPAPVYQWQQNGVDLVGETGSSLTLSDMISSDAGTYSVIASNACGSDSYGSIVVSVNPHPVIVTDPISVTKCAGETQTFTVAATNAGSYQWYKDNVALSDGVSGGGSIIAGATSTSLTISNLCATCNPGAYHVEVHGTGACSSDIAVSHSATLTINTPADITTAPLLSYTKCEGEDLVLSVVATGNPAPVYQWQQNGVDLVGETGSSLTLSDMISSDAGTYSVIASNACGSDSYGSIVVSVNPHPVIVTDPISVTKCAGETQTFTVAATNAGSYQWYKDNVALSDGVSGGGSIIAGATSTSLTISNLCATCNPGAYHVEVHGTGACSSDIAVSNSATLTINTPADITTAPLLSYTKCEGEDLVLSVVATGNPAPVYQWQQNGIDLVGETGSSLTLSDMISSDAGTYSVIASNACGSDSYGSIVVSVNPHPVIVTDPISVTKCAGETQTFTVAATNAGSYQWFFNNNPITGKNAANATILVLPEGSVGNYSVIVNGAGACSNEAVISKSAFMAVNNPIVITTQPLGQLICENESVAFVVNVTGTQPSFQWYKDNNPIVGAVGNYFSIGTLNAANAGKFKVEIKGTCSPSGVTSSEAELIVRSIKPPVISTNKPDGMCVGQVSTLLASGCAGTVHWYSDGNEVATGTTLTTASTATFTARCEALGCFSFATSNAIKPVQLSGLSYTATKQATTCFAGTDATLELNPTGSAGTPYTVTWNSLSASSLKVTGLTAGDYAFTLTDKVGCSITGIETLSQPSQPRGTVASTDISCFNAANGKITLTATSDYGNFSYSLNGAANVPFQVGNSQVINDLTKGIFTVKVVDGKGCDVLPTTSITLNEPPLLSLVVTGSVNPKGAITQDGSVAISITGGTKPYSVAWFNATNNVLTNGIQNDSTTSNISGLSGGTYKVLVTDKNGCQQAINATLTTPSVISLTTKVDSITCFGKADARIAITITGGVKFVQSPDYQISWKRKNANGSIDVLTANATNLSNLVPGNYDILVTDANGITASSSVVLTEPSLLKVAVTKVLPNYCSTSPLGEISLTAEGGRKPYSVKWDNSAATSLTVSNLNTGTYTATLTDNSGCSTTTQAVVLDSTKNYTVAISYQPPTCFGRCDAHLFSTVTGGAAPYQYNWSNIASTLANPTAVCGGTTTVLEVKDARGCVLTSQSQTLLSPTPRVLGLAQEKEVCPTQAFDLTASSLTWAKNFTWTLPNGKTKTGISIQADTLGVYQLVALDENSCGGQQTIRVIPTKNISVLFTIPSTVPVNKEVIAVDFSSPTPSLITWEFPVSVTLISQDPNKTTFKFSQKGFFKIKELATINNCVYPLTKEVEVVDQIDDKNFPAALNYVKPTDFIILGNPTGNDQVTLEVDNEAKEAFVVVLSAALDGKIVVEKSFVGLVDKTITIPLPPNRNDAQYVVTLISATVKTSKKLIVIR